MKQELIEKLKTLLEESDIVVVKRAIGDLRDQYKSESTKERNLQLEAWKEQEHSEDEEFEYSAPKEDEEFAELVTKYKERIKEHSAKIATEQKANLAAKKDLLNQLEEIVKQEEHIGKAFSEFKEINEKWKVIGNVPRDSYQEIHDKFQRLRDDFFYNINIYKALQENDLKVNLKKKEELIEAIKGLDSETKIKELESKIKAIQKDWSEIGPSPKENYKELGDTYYGSVKKVYERIQVHYDELKSKMAENLELKKAVVEEVKIVLEEENSEHNHWVKSTEKIIALQEKWKTIGFANKKEGEVVWSQFKKLGDSFFEKKNKFYEARSEKFAENKVKKEKVIERAKELQESTEWKDATNNYIKLQDDWKKIGSTFQKDEQKLWQKFRAACDTFFNRKKEHFKEQDQVQEENLHLKLQILEELKQFNLTNEPKEDIKALKEFSSKWNAIGFVPKKNIANVRDTYNALMDEKFGALTDAREEGAIMSYELRVEALKNSSNPEDSLKKESFLLRDQISKLQKEINQYENNMGFFADTSGANPFKKEVEKKIKGAHREIGEIKKKLQLLK